MYNVTVNLSLELEEEWLAWMKGEHIPQVLDSGKFLGAKIFRIRFPDTGNSGVNFSVQYSAENLADVEAYIESHAPALREKTRQKYGDELLFFRTILEEV